MYEFTVTPEMLLVVIAGLLALAFDYFPKLAAWFDPLDVSVKRQVMAGLVIGLGLVIFAGECAGLFVTNLVCDVKGFFDLCYVLFLSIGVNQGVHILTKPSAALRARMFRK